MPVEDSLRNEHGLLRSELQHLKQCQLQYFLVSVTATGAITSLNSGVLADSKVPPLMYLAPLLIVIPCWWTFFDKATTITRLVGYIRVLERALKEPALAKYHGYETALSLFRKLEDKDSPVPETPVPETPVARSRQVWRVLKLGTRHRYWMVNWYTFLLLSVVCCVLPFGFGVASSPMADPRAFAVWLAVALICGSAYYTLRVLFDLVFGHLAYDKVAAFWETVLPDTVRKGGEGA